MWGHNSAFFNNMVFIQNCIQLEVPINCVWHFNTFRVLKYWPFGSNQLYVPFTQFFEETAYRGRYLEVAIRQFQTLTSIYGNLSLPKEVFTCTASQVQLAFCKLQIASIYLCKDIFASENMLFNWWEYIGGFFDNGADQFCVLAGPYCLG